MWSWRSMDRAPQDGRWIIAIHRHEPDRRAVIRWDPSRAGDARPWHVASCEHCYPADAFTDWMPFPPCPVDEAGRRAEDEPPLDQSRPASPAASPSAASQA